MPFMQSYTFDVLVNEAERLIVAELERQLDEKIPDSICLCNDCILDMAAYALNLVKPLYRVSLLGSLYTQRAMEWDSYSVSIRQAVSQAIEKISKNPSHD